MDWKVSAIVIGVVVVSVAIVIIVLAVKLRSARKLADQRWTSWQRAKNDLEQITDQVTRLLYEIKVKELTNNEAIEQLHTILDLWRPTDDPVPGGDGNG